MAIAQTIIMIPSWISSPLFSMLGSAVISFAVASFMIGRYKEKVDTAEKNIGKLENEIKELTKQICKLEGGIERDRTLISSMSPLGLTNLGKAALLDSNGKDFVDKHEKEFIREIKEQSPKTAYDVQELSKKVIERQISKDDFNPIKNYVFKEGMKLEGMTDVLAIYLRDKALEELDFNIKDIKD